MKAKYPLLLILCLILQVTINAVGKESPKNYELTPEEVVTKIIQNEKAAYEEELRLDVDDLNIFRFFTPKDDSYWEKERGFYLEMENRLRENKDEIQKWEVAGPLNYAMSPNQMKETIEQRFRDMISSNCLMRKKSFNEKYKRKDFLDKGNNMTRIWGAEFLNSNLLKNIYLKAVDHFLIVDDDATEIEVKVWPGGGGYPVLSSIKNANILAPKIEGEKCAGEYGLSTSLSNLKYRDFADPGNIIKDQNGVAWIVDTELKSFDPPLLDSGRYEMQKYLQKRFKALYDRTPSQPFKISVLEIGLK